jgi:hypothetical protein
MTSAQATEATETALREISEAALGANCGHCWAEPGEPCSTALSGGTHVARFARAARKGLITSADLSLVLDVLDGFSEGSVLYEARGLAA